MTRRKFAEDVAKAAKQSFQSISEVRKGVDNGQLDFAYAHKSLSSPLTLQLMTMDIDSYPEHPGFLAFTQDQHSTPVANVLEQFSECTENKSIQDALHMMSQKLTVALDAGQDFLMEGATDFSGQELSDGDETVDAFQDEDEDDEETYIFDDSVFGLGPEAFGIDGGSDHDRACIPDRMIQDLRKAKAAGFNIGQITYPAHAPNGFILCLSIPINHLGLPDEVLTAWSIKPSEHLVLLLAYPQGYVPLEKFVAQESESVGVRFRFGRCDLFKPSTISATRSFDRKSNYHRPMTEHAVTDTDETQDTTDSFNQLYVSPSIDLRMNTDFASLIKLRTENGKSWDGAAAELRITRAKSEIEPDGDSPDNQNTEDGSEALISHTVPPILNRDFLLHDPDGDDTSQAPSTDPIPLELYQKRSLPLIAAQFALRGIVKGAQYCMVCHCTTGDSFVAMKPYVCSDPLCLFQYMSLGFGPSIEHELVSQPLVVDLLISFCYAAVADGRLRELPMGLGVFVPVVAPSMPGVFSNKLREKNQGRPIPVTADFSRGKLRIESDELPDFQPIKYFILDTRGDDSKDPDGDFSESHLGYVFHCVATSVSSVSSASSLSHGSPRYLEFECFSITKRPNRSSSSSLIPGTETLRQEKLESSVTPQKEVSAHLHPYQHDFDSLSNGKKSVAMLQLLDTLPTVDKMRRYLLNTGFSLERCPGVSEAALAIMRWIVASNRSLIVQTDTENRSSMESAGLNREGEKLVGLDPEWMQFRFAQGSPEQEQLFLTAVDRHARALKPDAPTNFAWHGSAASSWHGIIREGLNYNELKNGRAYGNGVYFSRDLTTSINYARPPRATWAQSQLRMEGVFSLCEIVNRTDMYVSRSPHYVVNRVDWIQCRYLVVQRAPEQTESQAAGNTAQQSSSAVSSGSNSDGANSQDQRYVRQDPECYVRGLMGDAVHVPVAANLKSRQTVQETESSTPPTFKPAPVGLNGSVVQDDFDKLVQANQGGAREDGLREGGAATVKQQAGTGQSSAEEPDVEDAGSAVILDPTKTTFRPGTVDIGTLPKLPSPTWAGQNGAAVLGRELRKLQKAQSSTPLHELGWYIDFEKKDNLFHWFVELHSFDPSLPLGRDMLDLGVASIVLELRFGPQFPLTPPFVRVVRPRFVPFLQGGGGNVTAGGAMCMELLTNSGWSPANSLESVIVQVRMAIAAEETPARLERSGNGVSDYGIHEAVEAYRRAAKSHGWQVPTDLALTTLGG